MTPTRVLLAGMPTILREIVRRIMENEQDIMIIAEVPDVRPVMPEMAKAGPDVVILGAEQMPESEVVELLRERCRTRILEISSDGSQTILFEMLPYRVPLGELGPESLLAVIRGAAAGGETG
ncbi:hypothetical protein AB0K60_13330 [Thermopolyspora sp. NPDC052614]|uniref:hypothetical protein n=1 Tax=Thermopolyspora sp. NPDC052614 TaxID=3155682 RepID=UPI00343332D2